MNSGKKLQIFTILTAIFLLLFSTNVFAAVKTISSVGLRVSGSPRVGSSMNDISINYGSDTGSDINITTVNDTKYYIFDAELINAKNRDIKVGDEVKIRVKLAPNYNEDSEYAFKGTYSRSNINISGAEYVSASKQNENLVVTIKLKHVKGEYPEPEELEWSESIGRARWINPSGGSNYFEVVLRRGSNEVERFKAYNGTNINFYPYMTKKGTYTFKVRTVAATENARKYGSSSAWVESDEFYLDEEHISDGRGRIGNGSGPNPGTNAGPGGKNLGSSTPGAGQANVTSGWIKEGNYWYYRYPNGTYKKNGWEKINNKWYLFDAAGIMLTGWQKVNGSFYYLNPEGDMKTGWHKDGEVWYYLSMDANNNEGHVVKDSWLQAADGRKYYVNSTGAMCEAWNKIGDKWYYFYPGAGNLATNTYINTFYVDSTGAWVQ